MPIDLYNKKRFPFFWQHIYIHTHPYKHTHTVFLVWFHSFFVLMGMLSHVKCICIILLALLSKKQRRLKYKNKQKMNWSQMATINSKTHTYTQHRKENFKIINFVFVVFLHSKENRNQSHLCEQHILIYEHICIRSLKKKKTFNGFFSKQSKDFINFIQSEHFPFLMMILIWIWLR